MREIKFRAWAKPFKEMNVINGFTSYHKGNLTIFKENEKSSTCMDYDIVLMQYTGLKDKNGKEIYESDIYRWKGHEVRDGKQIRPERIGVVIFDIYEMFKLRNIIEGNGTLEVIGNIYENSELLGEK